VLTIALLGVFAVPALASAESVTIDSPANGANLQSSPANYSGTGSKLVIIAYSPNVIYLVRNSATNALVDFGIDGVNIGSGLWTNPANVSLPDGSYKIHALQNSVAPALYDDLTADSTFTIDSVPPDTTLDSANPPSPTNSPTRTFNFHGDDPAPSSGIHFECQIDGGAWSTCSSPYTTPNLAEGSHDFAVRAVDAAGNIDASPATASWVLDTTPPDITINTPSNKQHFQLDSNVSPSYHCDDPLSGGPPPVASGIASCTDSGFSTEVLGPHLFTVDATDHAGNTSSKTYAYVIDPRKYDEFVKSASPIAYYRLNEGLGASQMLDSSGNGHDGTYQNGIALRRTAAPTCERRPHPPHACDLAGDPQDYSAYFPPRDGHAYVNGITAPTHAYTLEAWVNPADGNDMMIAGHGGGGQIFIHNRHLAFRQTQDTVEAPGPSIPIGSWTHVAATWNGSVSRLYVNGVEVASSNSANKAPSGTSTFFVGYGDQAPWMHGGLDEVAYYDKALSADDIADRWEIGTASDHPSPTGPHSSQSGPQNTNTAIPYTNVSFPVNNATYAPGKVPDSQFDCSDLDGPGDVASCDATIDYPAPNTPISSGDPLPQSPGTYHFTVVATDIGGNTYSHTHTYVVEPYSWVVGADNPVAYWRLGDGQNATQMYDQTGQHPGEYKNNQNSGPIGIAGDGDVARHFVGDGGYGFVNGIAAPPYQSSMEVWANPDDLRDEALMGHGDGGELDIIGGHFSYRHMDQTVTASIGPGCPAPAAHQWFHVVGTWDGVNITIYVNGKPCGSLEATKRPSSISTFYVGYGELAPWFAGSLDEAAYFSTALSAERVYEHYIADPPADLSLSGGGSGGGGGGSGGGSGSGSGGGSSSGGDTGSGSASSGGGAPAGTQAQQQTKPHWVGLGHKKKHKHHKHGHH